MVGDVAPDVERLVVDDVAPRVQHGQERARHVLHVDERSPGGSVAHDQHLAREMGEADEVVHHQIDAEPGGEPVDRGVAQERGAEAVVRERGDVALDEELRHAVGGHRAERCGLGDGGRRVGRAVEAARRGEQEALDAGGPRELCQPH